MKRRRWGRSSSLQPIGGLVLSVVKKAPTGDVAAVDEITWRRAVGVSVAARTRPVKLARGVLWVRVASSAWAQELSLLKETLLARLAEQGIEVTDVRFRVGDVAPPQRTPGAAVTTKKRPRAPIPPALSKSLERVDDEELRRVIEDAAAHNLAWQDAVAELPTSTRRGARDLRSSARGTAPSGRDPADPAASRGKRGGR